MKQLFSGFMKLNLRDLINGLVMSVIGAIVGIIGPSIYNMTFIFDWPTIWKTAAAAAFAYLVKNLMSNNEGKMLKSDADIIGGRPDDRK